MDLQVPLKSLYLRYREGEEKSFSSRYNPLLGFCSVKDISVNAMLNWDTLNVLSMPHLYYDNLVTK